MINEHVIDLSSTVANSLATSKWKAFPANGSPLYDLVQANIGGAYYSGSALTLESIVTDALNQDAGGDSIHTEILTETVEKVAATISGNIALVKTKLSPLYQAMLERFNEEVGNTPVRVGIPVEVRPNIYHRIWGLQTLANMVEPFGKQPLVPYEQTVRLPEIDYAELVSKLKTGVSSVDEVIAEWLEDQVKDKLLKVYNHFFRLLDGKVLIGRSVGHNHCCPAGFDRNDYLMAYVLATGFLADQPTDVTNMSPAFYENYMTKMRAACGRVVFGVIEDREVVKNARKLVFNYQNQKHPVTGRDKHILHVNQDVLLDFYENGGSPETLFGAAVSDFGFDIEKMLGAAQQLQSKWGYSLAAHASEVNAKMFDIKRTSLRVVLSRYINELPEDELPGPREEVLNKIKDTVGALAPNCFENTEYTLQDVICDVFFPDTNAKIVVRTMEEVHNENPDMSARECALFAVIDLTSKWLASQIRCAKA